MKRLLLILLCFPLIFNSCKKEEDIANNTNTTNNNLPLTYQNIEGWWKYKYNVMSIIYTTFGDTTLIEGELDTTFGYDAPLFISSDSIINPQWDNNFGYSIINGDLKVSINDTCAFTPNTNRTKKMNIYNRFFIMLK